MKKRGIGEFTEKVLKSGVVSWICLILVWQLISMRSSPDLLPSPFKTWEGFLDILKRGVLWDDIRVSMGRVLAGWSRGLAVAIPLGLLIGRFRIVRMLAEPVINFFRFVPAIGFLTLFLLWFGVGEESKVVLIMYATMFPVAINTIAGVQSIDPVKYQAAQSLGASSLQSFLTVTIPGAVPGMFTGIRLGLSGAIISIVGAEMLAANEGIATPPGSTTARIISSWA